jgi:ankyrin repeat protein
MRVILLLTVFLQLGLLSGLQAQSTTKLPPVAKLKIDYNQHIKPILAANCFGCHGQAQQQSGLRLDLRQNALRGGDYGSVIVPGNSAESKMILRLTGSDAGLQMPPTGALDPELIGVLRAWIDQGADMPGRASEEIKERKPTDPKVQSFLDAIHRQDLAAVRASLTADRSLATSADSAGSTALMHAAYAGTLDIMRELVDRGANVKARSERKATALHWAVADAAKLKFLLSKGAEIDAKTVEGRTTLYLAVMQPAGAPIVQHLLEAGADPNARTITGVTPLFPAVAASLESARLLIAKGANANARTETGGAPLMAAAQHPRAVELLVAKGADVKARTKRGETALANAANFGNVESVKLLLEKGADVNSVDYRGYTPLMHAAYYDGDSAETIRVLLAKGANVNVTGEGETPLTLAAKRGETEVTRLLREAQAASRQNSSVAANK